MNIIDQQQRLDALDPTRSFIVQAPAGSGKTEILTQRVLRLLATVEAPEHVVAITFTRKAAAEMRARLIESLKKAQHNAEPEAEHHKRTWQLARDALARDKQGNWQLIANPNRLRIMTIDALCARISRAAPLLTQFGAQPDLLQDPSRVYQRAARALINSLDTQPTWRDALVNIMLHLDNNQSWVEELLMAMLARRDQWLGHVMSNHQREHLEAGLINAVSDILSLSDAHLPQDLVPELLSLYRFAAQNLGCDELDQWPEADVSMLAKWRTLAEWLLTSTGDLRKSATTAMGFPAQTAASSAEQKAEFKDMKLRMKNLLQALESHKDFIDTLSEVLYAPPLEYTDQQWQLIESLLTILPILVAELTLQFKAERAVDFIEVSAGAIRALGCEDNPSAVALNLDYQIQHLLVDEFQDTSVTQYRLLELLTAGWTPDDGRTLFIVGDPMQSIYRFREAEVGLFLRARHFGLGHIPLQFLQLSMNFRSTTSVIEWINQTFVDVFPHEENIATGAVPYSPSTAANPTQEHSVEVHALLDEGFDEEATRVAEVVAKERAAFPEQTMAILVRSRTHLLKIIPALKREGIRFQAVEVEKLSHCVVIQDLLSLTRALLHLEDRVAWLAVLRAPWCGLTLADLHAIGRQTKCTILSACHHATLTADGEARLAKVLPTLQYAYDHRQRSSLKQWVKSVWHQLGGPACLHTQAELDNANTFFTMLDALDEGAMLPELSLLEQKLDTLFAGPDPNADPALQIMTIHKSKGLEFDSVLVPSLERRGAMDESSLLLWQERPRRDEDEADLLLAPIKYIGDDYDPIYRHIRRAHNQKGYFENIRLLYVAVTRAKRRIHLFGTVSDPEASPASSSFLGLLWPSVAEHFEQHLKATQSATRQAEHVTERLLQRLPLANMPDPVAVPVTLGAINTLDVDLDETASKIGNVIHAALQTIALEGFANWDEQRIEERTSSWRALCQNEGIPLPQLDDAVTTVQSAVRKTCADEQAKWLFSPSHSDAHSEYPLSLFESGEIVHLVLDRTFIDQDGIRWIIDYKTSTPREGESEHDFFAREQARYADQLNRYARAMQLMENRPIRCALYFPLLQRLSVGESISETS